MKYRPDICPMCSSTLFSLAHIYHIPPIGETNYRFNENEYYRELWKCDRCGHFLSIHQMFDSRLYEGEYNDATYQDYLGIVHNYDRIMALPTVKSDNNLRVFRITSFIEPFMSHDLNSERSVLDVGSGLCVFLSRMKELNWNCMAIDPDQKAIRHARENVGVLGVCSDFNDYDGSRRNHLITFNRVLEHVLDPREMIQKATKFLHLNGIVYIEVPDGEVAEQDGYLRDEFSVDHLHIFSFNSLTQLLIKSGLNPLLLSRCKEPSGKYSLYSFSTVKGGNLWSRQY